MYENNKKRNIKIILVGEKFSGKTCLLQRIVFDKDCGFNTSDCYFETFNFDKKTEIQFWEIRDNYKTRMLRETIFKNCHAVIITIEPFLIDKNGYIKNKINEIRQTVDKITPIFILMTKVDLIDQNKMLEYKKSLENLSKYSICFLSSLNNYNVKESLNYIVENVLNIYFPLNNLENKIPLVTTINNSDFKNIDEENLKIKKNTKEENKSSSCYIF